MNVLSKIALAFVGEKQYRQSYLGHSSYCKHPKESLLITATYKEPGFNHGMSWSQWKEGWGRMLLDLRNYNIRNFLYFNLDLEKANRFNVLNKDF